MDAMEYQITGVLIVYTAVCSGADQRRYQSSASLTFVWGIHRGRVNSPHKRASNAENVSIGWRHNGTGFHLFLLGWTTAAPHSKSLDETGRY